MVPCCGSLVDVVVVFVFVVEVVVCTVVRCGQGVVVDGVRRVLLLGVVVFVVVDEVDTPVGGRVGS